MLPSLPAHHVVCLRQNRSNTRFSPSATSARSPYNARTAARLNFILIRIVTSGDNDTSLSGRAPLEGKHFESSEHTAGWSLTGGCTQAKGKINQKVSSGSLKGLMLEESKSCNCKLTKATLLIITVHFKDCSITLRYY